MTSCLARVGDNDVRGSFSATPIGWLRVTIMAYRSRFATLWVKAYFRNLLLCVLLCESVTK